MQTRYATEDIQEYLSQATGLADLQRRAQVLAGELAESALRHLETEPALAAMQNGEGRALVAVAQALKRLRPKLSGYRLFRG